MKGFSPGAGGMSWADFVYQLILPLYVVLAAPSWLGKTVRRQGWNRELAERFGFYGEEVEFEPCGAVHVHAVSVGETVLALKLIRLWAERDSDQSFVLAVATATARQMAREQLPPGVRLCYQPVDFSFLVRRYLKRFHPGQVVLVEGEMWPNLMRHCARMGVPVRLVNARMSPRSRRRYQKFAAWVRPVFSRLDLVAVQNEQDAHVWEHLGVAASRVVTTGSLKFDPRGARRGELRKECVDMVGTLSHGCPVVLAASTHAGEEVLLARAAHAAGALPVIVPRHAERRREVAGTLEEAGFVPILRSEFAPDQHDKYDKVVLVVDSTGELRDWLEVADAVIIGKSFLARGGQNPCEAVLAVRPVLFGPHMENFEPLARELVAADGAIRVQANEIAGALADVLTNPLRVDHMTRKALHVLEKHEGATSRTIDLLESGGNLCPATKHSFVRRWKSV